MANFDDLFDSQSPPQNKAPQGGINASTGQGGQPFSRDEYAARKHAEREAAFELSDNTAAEVAGNSGRFRQYLDVQAKFDRYSAVNALLILAQKPESTKIGDFEYWKDRGGFVRSGQSAITIIVPHEYTKEDGSPGVGYNIKKVFDISQVSKGKAALLHDYDNRQILSVLINKAPVKIIGVDTIPDGLGAVTNIDTGEISVLKGMGFADTFRSLVQELAVNNLIDGNKTQRDTKFSAYCATYMLCKKYGVDTKSFDFSNAGSILGGMDAQAVKYELAQIRDAAAAISGRMEKQLAATQKAPRAAEAR